MKQIIALFKFIIVVSFSLYLLLIATTVFQRADDAKKGRMLRHYTRRILQMLGLKHSCAGAIPTSLHDCGLTPQAPGVTVISNHISFLDIFSLDAAIPSRFVAKSEIASWPIFGAVSKAIGTLFIDRSSKRAILGINAAIQGALQERQSVALFAEGTTTFGNSLLPLRSNFLAPCVSLGAKLQPVVLVYYEDGKPTTKAAYAGDVTLFGSLWNVCMLKQGSVVAHFLEPIDPTGLSRHELGHLCQERMIGKLKEIWGDEFIESDPQDSETLAKIIAKG